MYLFIESKLNAYLCNCTHTYLFYLTAPYDIRYDKTRPKLVISQSLLDNTWHQLSDKLGYIKHNLDSYSNTNQQITLQRIGQKTTRSEHKWVPQNDHLLFQQTNLVSILRDYCMWFPQVKVKYNANIGHCGQPSYR